MSTQWTGRGVSQDQTLVEEATQFWLQHVHDSYPNLHHQAYFLPPIHFNKVSYDIQTVAGQMVLVPKPALNQSNIRNHPVFTGTPSQYHLPGCIWPTLPVSSGPLPLVYQCNERDDRAQRIVLQHLQEMTQREEEVMFVLSQLDFRKYLDKETDPVSAAAVRLLPRCETNYERGEFDILIIHPRHGLVVTEVKSVGEDWSNIPDPNKTILKRVKKAVNQLDKAHKVLSHLTSDLPHVNTTKILMMPNISSKQLLRALNSDPQAQEILCKCLGAPDTDSAMNQCLCADNLGPAFTSWWRTAVADTGAEKHMAPDVYEKLVARFGGPATTIDVPCVTSPRVEMKTLPKAVSHTGLRTAILTLLPSQVDLVNRPSLRQVFLVGPPGTGKTVVLGIKGLQWRKQRKDVHLLSSHDESVAATFLIEHQLTHALTVAADSGSPDPRVQRHMYDFKTNPGDVQAAVNTLANAADDELYVIADEAYNGREFEEFCTKLAARVGKLHLWAAAVRCDTVPLTMTQEKLTTPLRCPPCIVQEVARSQFINSGKVPNYTGSSLPAPTDGPTARWLRHKGVPGHTGDRTEDCENCGHVIANLMKELRVGSTGQDSLQYCDVIVVCVEPRDDLNIVKGLRARNVPVRVVSSKSSSDDVKHVALADMNVVTLTDWKIVSSLERRVVIGLGSTGWNGHGRLFVKSRSTAFLVWIDPS